MSEIEYETLEELSDEAFEVEEYNHHEFEDLWFDPDANCFYIYNGTQYIELIYEKRSNGSMYIQCYDIDNVKAIITLSKFKKQHSL